MIALVQETRFPETVVDRHPGIHKGDPDVHVWVPTPEALFGLGEQSMWSPSARLVPGMDEIVEQVAAGPRRCPPRVTIEMPADRIGPGTEERVRQAVHNYCALRHRQVAIAMARQRREGLGAIPLGAVLFVVGIVGSYYLSGRHVTEAVRLLLGDGVFLIVAWVGLWYPLDSLLFARRPLARERHVLHALAEAEIVVRAGPEPLQPAL